jgi:HEAT repeat protein
MKIIIFFCFFSFIVSASCVFCSEIAFNDKEKLSRIESHFAIEDYSSALEEAKELVSTTSTTMGQYLYAKALMYNGREMESISLLQDMFLCDKVYDQEYRSFLEDISWGVINKGVISSNYQVRLTSLIGAFLTNDAKCVSLLIDMMRDTNAILRSIAIQLSCNYRDEILKKEISRLFQDERVWMVRLEIIKSIGTMKMINEKDNLKKIIISNHSTYEEKVIAIQSLTNICDGISLDELSVLAKDSRAPMRQLACEMAVAMEIVAAKDIILPLVNDTCCDVRISALNAIILFYRDYSSCDEINHVIQDAIDDTNPNIAITSALVAMFSDKNKGEEYLYKWVNCKYEKYRRMAAVAISAAGQSGVTLALKVLTTTQDSYVKVNLAIGLIGQRQQPKKCCDILYHFMMNNNNNMIMWNRSDNSLLNILSPNQVSHNDQVPQYPRAVDMITRLQLLTMLTMMEYDGAEEVIKSFLSKKNWGVSGVAAATLVQEGDNDALVIVKNQLNDGDIKIRVQAALVMALFGKDETVIKILEEAFLVADREMKVVILEALGSIAMTPSYPFFVKVLNDPFQAIRVINASSFIQSLNR